jgi:hypothetical protein
VDKDAQRKKQMGAISGIADAWQGFGGALTNLTNQTYRRTI